MSSNTQVYQKELPHSQPGQSLLHHGHGHGVNNNSLPPLPPIPPPHLPPISNNNNSHNSSTNSGASIAPPPVIPSSTTNQQQYYPLPALRAPPPLNAISTAINSLPALTPTMTNATHSTMSSNSSAESVASSNSLIQLQSQNLNDLVKEECFNVLDIRVVICHSQEVSIWLDISGNIQVKDRLLVLIVLKISVDWIIYVNINKQFMLMKLI